MKTTTTPEANTVIQRRRATDWKARQPWTDQEHRATTEAADELSLKLYHLAQIVRMAAFAAEARRTLEGIGDAMMHRPEMRETLNDAVPAMGNWNELPDPTSEVLGYIASEMDAAAAGLTGLAYDLANRLRAGEHGAAERVA